MKPKILIVDDEPLNRATLEAFLVGEGYELLFASSGYEACAKALVELPDLILLDVMMHEMDGFSATRRIRADPVIGRIPIILVTALDDDRSRLEGLRAGADDFLSKPCRRDEMRARVRTVVSLNRFRVIAEQRARFEQLFALAPGPIVVVNETGVVVAANTRASAHPVGVSIFEGLAERHAEPLRAVLAAALRGEAPAACEVRTGAGAAECIFQVRTARLAEDGASLAMLVFEDVTAAVRARENLEQLNASLESLVRARTRELEESNRMLMSYASFVSHDLRSPLTVVKGYLSMLNDGVVPLDADAAPMIAHAYRGTIVMQELIQNILQLAQDEHDGAQRGVAVSVDPNPVVRRLTMLMRDLFPQPVPTFEIATLPRVGVSAVLVERVFYNLLGNALKYSAQNPRPLIQIGTQPSPDGPVIFVRDNGVGFDGRDADRLFREFSRLSTSGAADGLGLGLSLVGRLLKAHGGRIWAESAVGAGATFFVQLPPPASSVP